MNWVFRSKIWRQSLTGNPPHYLNHFNSRWNVSFHWAAFDYSPLIGKVFMIISEMFHWIWSLRENCPNTELFLVRIFLYSDWITKIYSVNLLIQSEYRKIWIRNDSVFGHFSHSADVYFHHQNCHVRSHSSSWFSVACATPLVVFLTSCLLHLVRQSFCWNCFRDSDFGIATLWFIGFYISFIYFVTPIHCSYQLGLYF